MRGRATFAALAAAFLFLTVPGVASRAARAFEGRAVDLSAEYDRAAADFASFLKEPARIKDTRRWKAFADRFEKIYETDRGGARADDALFMVGEVRYERYRIFRRREDLDAALSAYRRLLEHYRFSSRRSDALVRLADIHYYNLDDTRRAYLLYRRAARENTDSEAARRAGVRVVAIEARHPELAAQDDAPIAGIVPPPAPSRPLPSPGAVIGAGRFRNAAPGAPAVRAPRPVPRRGAGEVRSGAGKARSDARKAPPAPRRDAAPPPGNPLLQEGAEPLRRPSDDLPVLRSTRPPS